MRREEPPTAEQIESARAEIMREVYELLGLADPKLVVAARARERRTRLGAAAAAAASGTGVRVITAADRLQLRDIAGGAWVIVIASDLVGVSRIASRLRARHEHTHVVLAAPIVEPDVAYRALLGGVHALVDDVNLVAGLQGALAAASDRRTWLAPGMVELRLRQRIAYELGPDAAAAADIGYDLPAVAPLTSLTRDALLDALAATRGNKSRAAARLGLERTKLYRELERHGIEEFTPADGAARMKPALTDGDD